MTVEQEQRKRALLLIGMSGVLMVIVFLGRLFMQKHQDAEGDITLAIYVKLLSFVTPFLLIIATIGILYGLVKFIRTFLPIPLIEEVMAEENKVDEEVKVEIKAEEKVTEPKEEIKCSYTCPYCGTTFSEKMLKRYVNCVNCGAPITIGKENKNYEC